MWLIEASRDEGKQYDVLSYLVAHSQQCSSVLGFNNTDIGNELCIVQQAVKNGSSEKVRRSEIQYHSMDCSALFCRLIGLSVWGEDSRAIFRLSSLSVSSFFFKVSVSFDSSNVIADHLRLRYIQMWEPKVFQNLKELSVSLSILSR